jgi:hypothetical protein
MRFYSAVIFLEFADLAGNMQIPSHFCENSLFFPLLLRLAFFLVDVRALRRSVESSSGMIYDVDVELERDVLGRETGVVAASLIAELAVNGEVAGIRSSGGAQPRLYDERTRVNA